MSLQPTRDMGVVTDYMVLLCTVVYNEISLSKEYIFFRLSVHGVYFIKVKASGWPWQFGKTYLGGSCQGGTNGLVFSLCVLSICSWKLMVGTPLCDGGGAGGTRHMA